VARPSSSALLCVAILKGSVNWACYRYMNNETDESVGLAGSGCDCEFEITGETDKAYHLAGPDGRLIWMLKSAFSEDGSIYIWGLKIMNEKLDTTGPL
jgi:hypothetical protein